MRALVLLLLAGCSREAIVYAPPDLAERPSPFPAQCDAPPDAGLGRCDDGHWKWRGPAPVELTGGCSAWSASFSDAWFACTNIHEGPLYGASAIVHWDGAHFSTEWVDTAIWRWGAIAVWGSSHDDLWAVGNLGQILHSDGSGCWTRVPTITAARLVAVAGRAPDDVWAIGATGTAIHWNGVAWSVSQTGTSADLTAIAVTDGRIWVTTSDGEILRWEGTRWRTELSAGAALRSIWAYAADDAWAVGDDGTILRWDGSSWTSLPPDLTGCRNENANSDEDDATHVWGSGPNDVSIACTWHGVHWDGVTFSPFVVPNSAWVFSAYAVGAPDDAWSTGWGLFFHYDGMRWSEFAIAEDYLAISVLAPDDVWATSDWGRVHHFDGSAWRISHQANQKLGAVFARAPDDVWAGGATGILLHYDGREWSEQKSAAGYWITSIWASGPNDVWVGGDQALLHFDGNSWNQVPFQEKGQQQWRVWGTASDCVWVMSSFYSPAHHFDGARWTDFPTGIPKGGYVEDIWGSDRDHVWATGCGGVIRWDGTKWSPIDLGIKPMYGCGPDFAGVRGTSDEDLWLPQWYNSIEHWDGHQLQCSTFPYTALRAIGGTPDNLWVVGNGGAILHRE